MTVGGNLKRIRKLKKVSVAVLAQKTGINPESIYAWERGEYGPNEENLQSVAKVLGVAVKDFYDENLTDGDIKPAIPEKALGESWEATAFRKIIEGDAEYVLVHKNAFENHRFTSVEQIEAHSKELAEARAEVHRLAREFIEFVKETRGLGSLPQLPKVEETKKDTAV